MKKEHLDILSDQKHGETKILIKKDWGISKLLLRVLVGIVLISLLSTVNMLLNRHGRQQEENLIIENMDHLEAQYVKMEEKVEVQSQKTDQLLDMAKDSYSSIEHTNEKMIGQEKNRSEHYETMQEGQRNIGNQLTNIANDIATLSTKSEEMPTEITTAINKMPEEVIAAVDKVPGEIIAAVDKVPTEVIEAVDKVPEKVISAVDKVPERMIGALDEGNKALSSQIQNQFEQLILTQETNDSTWIAKMKQLEEKIDEVLIQNSEMKQSMQTVFQSVSNGKKSVASALLTKGVDCAEDASFQEISTAIDAIIQWYPGEILYEYHSHVDQIGNIISSETNKESGGCFTKEIYHTHQGDPRNGGGCYGEKEYIDQFCGVWECVMNVGNYQKFQCTGCGAYEEQYLEISGPGWGKGNHLKQIAIYRTNCGKSSEEVEGYAANCGMLSGQIIGGTIQYVEIP